MSAQFPAVAARALLAVALPAALFAQQPPPATEVGAAQLALVNAPPKSPTKLTVTSPAFAPGGDIPMENTQYRGNIFPGLSWTAGPPETKAYVLIMQDPDAVRGGMPILHWTMVNIPANVMKLDVGLTAPPTGAEFGPNMRGVSQPYMGPRTPPGPKHRYHFQIFALDAPISTDASANYPALIAAMKDHVLASGEVIGLGSAPPPPQF